MKKASLVSIGNELLSGQTVDSNAAFLSAKLLAVGIPVVSCYTVGDDIDSIADKLELASKDGDIVLMTGGLGPTDDDVTRQGLAKLLGTQLQLQEELLEKIDSYFASRGLQMPAKSKAQAYIPAGTKAIANNLGSAPGIMAELQNKLFIALPGVPSEMKGMFEESVLAHLTELVAKQGQVAIAVGKVKCFGASEAKIAELLGSMMERGRNPLINCTVAFGTITLHITATAKDAKLAQRLVQKEKKTLIDLLGAGDLVYVTSLGTGVGKGWFAARFACFGAEVRDAIVAGSGFSGCGF